jgi:predicted metal-dependent hydrolase
VIHKDIKHLHVGVYPPNGRVRVAAPRRLSDDAVRLAVVSRLAWIRRHQMAFQTQARQSRREVVTGESHHVEGRRYRLDVIEQDSPPAVRVVDSTSLRVRVRPGMDRARREAVLQRWYRARLHERVRALLAKWEGRVGVRVAEVRLRRMKTRWGSCNPTARRIWLNLELAKKPAACLEYILVHELVHLLERRHTARFRELMDTLMPLWRLCRDELNRAALAHAAWRY